jgi:hypothetical protein
MFEARGNLRFQKEAALHVRIQGMFVLQAFDGDRAMQFGVEGCENFAESTLGMGRQMKIGTHTRSSDGGANVRASGG